MLTKLLKYEFKETARIIPFLYMITMFFAVVSLVASWFDMNFIKTTSSVILVFVGIAVFVITFVIIAIRFYRNLYSNEGYLMFTLPVKPHKLLASKTIVAFFWIIASLVLFIGALLLGMYFLGVDLSELSEIRKELVRLGFGKILYAIIPAILLSILYFISQIFFAITIGNLPCFHGMGVASSFIAFIVTYIALKIVETIATIFVPISLMINLADRTMSLTIQNMFNYFVDSVKGIEPYIITMGVGGFIFDIIMIGVLLYFTGRIMSRKVSLR